MSRHLSILLLLLACLACSKGTLPRRDDAVVIVTTNIAQQGVATKYPVMGTSFGNNQDYGIFVCQHGSTSEAHKSNSKNLKAKYNSDTPAWEYYYVSDLSNGSISSTIYDNLTLSSRADDATADLYAYAPYNQSVYSSGLSAIPYKISEQKDLMYAQENLTNANSNLDPESVSPLSATFTFKHAFALLEFRIRILNQTPGADYYATTDPNLNRITLTVNPEIVSNTARLYTEGTLNALTGTITGVTEESSISFSGDVLSSTHYTMLSTSARSFYLMLVPFEIEEDNQLFFTFRVGGQDLQPYYLQKNDVKHDDDTYGFQVGYKYIFNFSIDNYVRFDGFEIGVWEADILGNKHI